MNLESSASTQGAHCTINPLASPPTATVTLLGYYIHTKEGKDMPHGVIIYGRTKKDALQQASMFCTLSQATGRKATLKKITRRPPTTPTT